MIDNLFIQEKKFINTKLYYFLNFCLIFFKCYHIGYVLKFNSLMIYIKKNYLINFLTILKYNSVFLCSSLTDIVVIDHVYKYGNRFELNYVLLIMFQVYVLL